MSARKILTVQFRVAIFNPLDQSFFTVPRLFIQQLTSLATKRDVHKIWLFFISINKQTKISFTRFTNWSGIEYGGPNQNQNFLLCNGKRKIIMELSPASEEGPDRIYVLNKTQAQRLKKRSQMKMCRRNCKCQWRKLAPTLSPHKIHFFLIFASNIRRVYKHILVHLQPITQTVKRTHTQPKRNAFNFSEENQLSQLNKKKLKGRRVWVYTMFAMIIIWLAWR